LRSLPPRPAASRRETREAGSGALDVQALQGQLVAGLALEFENDALCIGWDSSLRRVLRRLKLLPKRLAMLTAIVRRAPKGASAGLWRRKSLNVRRLP